MEMSGAMTIFGVVMMTAMLGLIAWAGISALRGRQRLGPERRGAQSVLDERFAAGEIDEQEYERRRRALERPTT